MMSQNDVDDEQDRIQHTSKKKMHTALSGYQNILHQMKKMKTVLLLSSYNKQQRFMTGRRSL